MKKWIAMLLAALMVFSMAACAAKNEPAADQTITRPMPIRMVLNVAAVLA